MERTTWLQGEILGEDELRHAQAHEMGVPFVVLEHDDIEEEALQLIPEPLSREHHIVAYAQTDDSVMVALLNMDDLVLVEHLYPAWGGRRAVPRLTTRESIRRALVRYQKKLKDRFGALLATGAHAAEALVLHALYSRAGLVHIDLNHAGATVRHEIGELLHEALRLPEQAAHTLRDQLKALAKLLPARRPQEGRFKVDSGGETVSVQLSSVPTREGERLTLRLARQGQRGWNLEALGFRYEAALMLRRALSRRGVILACGAQGSGKSTLLRVLEDHLASPHRLIAHADGPELLRAALRQDPHVVVVDDMAGRETALLACAAASRGVVVLGALEAHSAAEGLAQLQQGEAPTSHALGVGLSLARRLCTKEFHSKARLSRAQTDKLEERGVDFVRVLSALKEEHLIDVGAQWKDLEFSNVGGCSECDEGYKGVIGLQELFDETGPQGLTLAEDGLYKAYQGLTSVEEVLRLN